jgi:hypothetical protein
VVTKILGNNRYYYVEEVVEIILRRYQQSCCKIYLGLSKSNQQKIAIL